MGNIYFPLDSILPLSFQITAVNNQTHQTIPDSSSRLYYLSPALVSECIIDPRSSQVVDLSGVRQLPISNSQTNVDLNSELARLLFLQVEFGRSPGQTNRRHSEGIDAKKKKRVFFSQRLGSLQFYPSVELRFFFCYDINDWDCFNLYFVYCNTSQGLGSSSVWNQDYIVFLLIHVCYKVI